MALILTEKQNIAEFIYKVLQKHWEQRLVNLRERVRIVSDLEKWRPEVVDIWQQKEGVKEYSIYFDDEFICRVNSLTSPYQLELEFLKGILEAYENNRIYFNLADYQTETELVKQITKDKKDKKQARIKKIDKLSVSPIVKETLKQLTEEEKDKVSDTDVKNYKKIYETAK
jgi:hypothetical protein